MVEVFHSSLLPARHSPAPARAGSPRRYLVARFRECPERFANTGRCRANANLPKPGSIDHECPALHNEESPAVVRMPAFPVIVPDDGGFLDGGQQPFDQRRLADTG